MTYITTNYGIMATCDACNADSYGKTVTPIFADRDDLLDHMFLYAGWSFPTPRDKERHYCFVHTEMGDELA